MIDRSMLLDALRINGLAPDSSDDEILKVFTALGYGHGESKEALKIIRTKFPAPDPYVPYDATKTTPRERVKLDKIAPDAPVPAPIRPQPIKIERVFVGEQVPKAPVKAPIKIPSLPREEKAQDVLPTPVRIASVSSEVTGKVEEERESPGSANLSSRIGPQSNSSGISNKSAKVREGWAALGVTTYTIILILIIVSISSYAYINKIGPFGLASYTEDVLVSQVSNFISKPAYRPSTYEVAASIVVVPRESGISPTTLDASSSVVELIEKYAALLGPDTNISFYASTSVERAVGTSTDWSLDLNSRGVINDAGFAVALDAVKKGSDFYIKVNRAPLLFVGARESLREQWFIIPHTGTSTASTSKLVTHYTDIYTKEFLPFLTSLTNRIDEEKLIELRGKPFTEKSNGQYLVHYDIGLKHISDSFAFFDTHTKMTLWADELGFPVSIQGVLELLPPQSATLLQGKQINITVKVTFSDINTPLRIQAPKDSKLIGDDIPNYIESLYKK